MKSKKKTIQLMLPKNIGAIQISNDLTLVERKIMNIILLNAFNIEKDIIVEERSFNKDNKKFYCIDISKIEDALGWDKYTQRSDIKKSLKKLIETSLQFNILKTQNTDNGKWNIITSLLSEVIMQEDSSELFYAFSNSIKDIIIKPSLYGWINLEEQKNIESRYALALLEYLEGSVAITKRTETKTEYIALDDYKKLIAGDKCNYNTFKDVNRFLVKSPLQELNDKTTITATANFQKKGRKVVGISFDVKKDKNNLLQHTLELDFNTTYNQNTDDIKNTNSVNHDTSHKETEIPPKPPQNANGDVRKINELMIQYNISEKKRKSFLEAFSSEYIEANIRYFFKQNQWKDKQKEIPIGLIIKAIEDNYANYGTEKEEITLRQKYILELREILNPFIDKTGKMFLRNILQDYQIYKERRDKEQTAKVKIRLHETFERMDFLKTELLKLGYSNENDIMYEIGIKTDNDFKRVLFSSKEELDVVRREVGHL